MNLITFCKPTYVYWLNFCPFGLGGYSDKGLAWRFEIPTDFQFCASNNLIEYIAPIITPWVDMLAGRLNHSNCALLMMDSSMSVGRETIEEDADAVRAMVRIETAHHHATLFLNVGIKEYSQWFSGWENNVADTLLCDFYCPDNKLTQIVRDTCPSQLPQLFQIVLLPNKISSWLTLLLLKLPVKEQLQKAHMRTKLGCGTSSPSILNPLESTMTSSSISSKNLNKTRLLEPFPWLSGRDDIQERLMTPWLWKQSKYHLGYVFDLPGKRPTQPDQGPGSTT